MVCYAESQNLIHYNIVFLVEHDGFSQRYTRVARELSGLIKAVFRRVFGQVLLAGCLLLSVQGASAQESGVTVLASIKPLQLIAQALTHGVSNTQVLLPPGVTPHDYALKPSDLRKVYNADLLLWLGPDVEPYLAKPVKMGSAFDLAVLNFDKAEVEAHHEGHDHGGHSHLYGDPHIWFSPDEALSVAQSLLVHLQDRDSDNAARYQENFDQFRVRLQALDERIKPLLSRGGTAKYVVYHDAYSYFEAHYGLSHMATVSERPEAKPGAKGLLNLRKMIEQEQVHCLFAEPQTDPRIVNILSEDSNLLVISLDPMAADVEISERGYEQFLEGIASRFAQCR